MTPPGLRRMHVDMLSSTVPFTLEIENTGRHSLLRAYSKLLKNMFSRLSFFIFVLKKTNKMRCHRSRTLERRRGDTRSVGTARSCSKVRISFRMDFIIVASAHHSSPQLTLHGDRLMRAATRDKQRRAESQRSKAASSSSLSISGAALRALCIKVLAEESPSTANHLHDGALLHCIILNNMQTGARDGFCLVPAAAVADHIFDVPTELLVEDRVVIFSVWDNLEKTAISEGSRGAAAAPAAEVADVDSPRVAAKRVALERPTGGTSPSVTRPMGRAPPKMHRAESALDLVPAVVTSEDLKELNELLYNGTIQMSETLERYVCARCMHLPALTLTMSCCGSVLCPHCLPIPPGVEGARREELLCPICHEEPLSPPQSHPKQDARALHLQKELKVLFMPQLKALRRARQSPDLKPGVRLMHSPVLGPL